MLRVDESYVSHRHHFCRTLLPIRRGYFVIVVSCEGDVVNSWVIGSHMNGAREV